MNQQDIHNIVTKQKAFFLTHATKSYRFRKTQLNKLLSLMQRYQQPILDALASDLHKSEFEAFTTEVGFNMRSTRHTIKHLKRWMKAKRVKGELFLPFTKAYVKPEPKGTVLIIGPFNYPFQLVIEVLIGAIAAGNTAIIKPSEFTPATEAILEKMINDHFPEEYLKVIKGDVTVSTMLLAERYDHIFFTGSTRVGQIVYEAASKHLTPVTLELGGKSPTIIDETANLKVAAERIAFAKFTNAGQTCIAPDYLYIHESVKVPFIQQLKAVIKSRYADEKAFGHIVNEHHVNRLNKLLPKPIIRQDKYFPPTLIESASWDDLVMKEEIFGPILPILTFTKIEDVIQTLLTKEKPLALYLFSEHKATHQLVFEQLSFGNGAINDALMQVSSTYLPFGGVGQSGMGAYHGKHSFDTFSHFKSYIHKSTKFDFPFAYPPHNEAKMKLIKKFIK